MIGLDRAEEGDVNKPEIGEDGGVESETTTE